MDKRITLKFALALKREYDTGVSMVQLSQKYKTDVNYVFNKFNIPRKTKLEYREWRKVHRQNTRYNLKWDCSSISNEWEAYIIGLFMADGYVSKTQTGIGLKKSDKKLVEKIKNYFSEKIKLQKDKTSYRFVISSINVCDNLKKLGVCHNKTKKRIDNSKDG